MVLEKSSLTELKIIPGIGEGIARKIIEYQETGRITRLGELKEEVPAGLRGTGRPLLVSSNDPRKVMEIFRGLPLVDQVIARARSSRTTRGIVINTDAHLSEQLKNMFYGVAMARRGCWLISPLLYII